MAPAIELPSLYHWLPLALLEVNTTLPPSQNVVAPPAVMLGVEGIGLTVTFTALDVLLHAPEVTVRLNHVSAVKFAVV